MTGRNGGLRIGLVAIVGLACNALTGTLNGDGQTGGNGQSGQGGSGGSSGCRPDYVCMPTAPDTGDYYVDCVARVNQFRACVCLPPLTRWTSGEACADEDAAYDPSHSAHAGFIAKLCSPEGYAQDECPAWPSETAVVSGCLQQMFDEGPPPTNPCDGSCFEMYGHFINMTNTSYTMVACGMASVKGQLTAVQDFQ